MVARSTVFATARNICHHGQYGGALDESAASPHTPRAPLAAAKATSSSARRVLPMPASPWHHTSCGRPATAAVRQSVNVASSSSRPTSSVRMSPPTLSGPLSATSAAHGWLLDRVPPAPPGCERKEAAMVTKPPHRPPAGVGATLWAPPLPPRSNPTPLLLSTLVPHERPSTVLPPGGETTPTTSVPYHSDSVVGGCPSRAGRGYSVATRREVTPRPAPEPSLA